MRANLAMAHSVSDPSFSATAACRTSSAYRVSSMPVCGAAAARSVPCEGLILRLQLGHNPSVSVSGRGYFSEALEKVGFLVSL